MLYPFPLLFLSISTGVGNLELNGREREGDIITCSQWSSFPSLTHFTKSACAYLLTVVSVGGYSLTRAPFLRDLPRSNSRHSLPLEAISSPQIAATDNDQLPWVRLTLGGQSCSEFPLAFHIPHYPAFSHPASSCIPHSFPPENILSIYHSAKFCFQEYELRKQLISILVVENKKKIAK